ncbi:MAG TPA: DUF2953 domain-containing protein [Clostridiales bacterium]|nr:DUF2953 domain-containing protein [Clostridiales bacterium]
MLYPVIFILAAIIISLILFIKVNTKFECVKKSENSDLVIYFFIFNGIIKKKHVIPITDIYTIGNKVYELLLSRYGILKDTDKEYTNLEELLKEYNYLDKAAKLLRLFLTSIQKYLIGGKVPEIKLKINIIYGTDDALWTGVLGGVIWAFAGNIDSLFSNKFKLTEREISIKPDFTKIVLDIEVLCILSIRVVHIIIAGFLFIFELVSEKIKNKR